MPLNNAQRDVVSDLVDDVITSLIESVSSQETAEHAVWSCFIGQYPAGLSNDALNPLLSLLKMYAGEPDIFEHHSLGEKPSIADIRICIFESVISAFHQAYPNRALTNPQLPALPPELKGMEKIRELFKQYATLTASGSIERYLLALKILVEKEKLGIPSFISSNNHIYRTNPGYAPGDFSGLDLSKLDLVRNEQYDDGDFKGWHLKNSNFDGTNFRNICLYGANFEGSSLRGADFSEAKKYDDVVTLNANIEGMYQGLTPPDRRATNFALVAKNREELNRFRQETLGMSIESAVETSCGSDTDIEAEQAGLMQSESISRYEKQIDFIQKQAARLNKQLETLREKSKILTELKLHNPSASEEALLEQVDNELYKKRKQQEDIDGKIEVKDEYEELDLPEIVSEKPSYIPSSSSSSSSSSSRKHERDEDVTNSESNSQSAKRRHIEKEEVASEGSDDEDTPQRSCCIA